MVNVALQLSGRCRYTSNSIDSMISNIIKIYKPDVFCSFWETINSNTISNLCEIISSNTRLELLETESQSTIQPYLDELFSKYNTYHNMPSMLYKFYKVNSLRKSIELTKHRTYDIVIQARTDNLFLEPLVIPKNINGVYCSNMSYSDQIDPYVSPRMVDNFYLGDTHSMNLAADTFWKLEAKLKFCKEQSLLHHIKIPEIIQSMIWNDKNIRIHSLPGNGPVSNFWYDIDRTDTVWK